MKAYGRILVRTVTRGIKRLAALPRHAGGGILIYTALAAPVMIGFTGLAVDGGVWYAEKRDVQSIADAAAVAGALELRRSGAGAVQQAAVSDTTTNGYDPAAGDTILVYNPPVSGPRAGDTRAIEVVVRRQAPLFFAKVLIEKADTIAGRAVASIGGNQTCLWSLSKTKRGAVSVSGGSTVNLAYGIFVNSDDDEALQESGKNSCITATAIRIVGDFSGDCVTKKPATKIGTLSDPLAEIKPPKVDACDYVNKITVNKGDNVELLPGVSFYMTAAAKVADNISIQPGAKVTLSAPTTDAQAGILFRMDKAANSNITHNFSGGATMTLDGILYFPSQGVNFAGGSDAKGTLTMIIADTMTVTGQSRFADLKNSTVGSNQYLTTVSIVE